MNSPSMDSPESGQEMRRSKLADSGLLVKSSVTGVQLTPQCPCNGEGYGGLSKLRPRSSITLLSIPVQYLFPSPKQHTRIPFHVLVDLFEVLNPMRRASDIRVYRDRHDSCRVLALLIESVELITGPIKRRYFFLSALGVRCLRPDVCFIAMS